MILKSYIVEQNLEILNSYQGTLIYGENIGIKDDIKQALKDKNKNTEIITFFEDEILKNKNILYQNVFNESLFSEKKIIFILGASDKIHNIILECLEKDNNNVKIYIFSEKLENRSKLKDLFAKSKKLAIFPCYKDNERTLINYVNKELREFKGLSGEIINLIISNSNMDRKVVLSEIMKIKMFFLEKKINKEEILEILNVKSDTSFDEIRDGALYGEKKKINKLLSEIELQIEDTFFYLNNLSFRIMKLQEIIKLSNGNKDKYEETIEKMKPPIFWKDKPIVMQQVKKWSLDGLALLTREIGEAETLIKKNSYLRNDIVVKELIINLTNKASQ
ncbi:MAG: DNA polymerase III subunit delta [Candidatus Pelagibacterales bacterium]